MIAIAMARDATWSAATRPGARQSLAGEFVQRRGERLGLIDRDERVAVEHLHEPGVGKRRGQARTELRAHDLVLGCPYDQHGTLERRQRRRRREHVAAPLPGIAGVLGEVPADLAS